MPHSKADAKLAKLAQNKLELEVDAKLKLATRAARIEKDIAGLQAAIHEAVQRPELPPGFLPIVRATEVLLEIQDQARLRLRFFLKTLDTDTVKKNGSLFTCGVRFLCFKNGFNSVNYFHLGYAFFRQDSTNVDGHTQSAQRCGSL